MGVSAGISAGAGLLGASMQSNAAGNAADTMAGAAANATAEQQAMFQQQQQNEAPYMAAGKQAIGQLQDQLPGLEKNFTSADFQSNPGYQFQLQQGQQAIQASAAARGLLGSTGTMKALDNYSQGMANTDYNNAYNQFNNNRQMNYNMLSGVTGIGQSAASGSNAAAQNAGNNISQNLMGAGNAQAAGQVGQANAFAGGLSSVANAGQSYMTMNALQNKLQPSVPYQAPPIGSQVISGEPSFNSEVIA